MDLSQYIQKGELSFNFISLKYREGSFNEIKKKPGKPGDKAALVGSLLIDDHQSRLLNSAPI